MNNFILSDDIIFPDELILPDEFSLVDEFNCNQLDEMITNRNFVGHALSTSLPPRNDLISTAFAFPEQYRCATSSTNSSKTTDSASLSSYISNTNMETTLQDNATNRGAYRESANFYASDVSNSSSAFGSNTVSSGKSSCRQPQSRHPKAKRQRFNREDDEDNLDDNSDSESILSTINDPNLFYSCNNGPKRRAKLFKIHICLRKYDIEITRDYLFDCFIALTKSTVIVAREELKSMYQEKPVKYRASHIFKVFIDLGTNKAAMNSIEMHKIVSKFIQQGVNQTEQQFSLEDMVEEKITDEDRVTEISFSSVKNRKSAICWVSACDVKLRFTPDCLNFDDFSESYRLQMWCLQNINRKFDPFDPLVLKLKKTDAMKRMLTDFQRKNHIRYKLKRVQTDIPFGDWRDELIEWFNDWIDNGWHAKKRQVLITGPPNAGKTSFIENVLLKGVPSEAILTPENSSNKYQISNFAWAKSDELYNSIVYADEFQINCYDQCKLKVILQGGKFSPARKFINSKTSDEIQLKVPMIFVGNYHFPKSAIELGIPERFRLIQIPDELPVYMPSRQEPYKVELFDSHIHVYNSIQCTTRPESSVTSLETEATSPETIATCQETSATSLKTSATCLNTNETSPETNALSQQTNESSIETRATSIETSSTCLNTNETMPETNAWSPETSASSPETNASSPETSATSPETSASSPETSASSPETSASSPETSATIPVTITTKLDEMKDFSPKESNIKEQFSQQNIIIPDATMIEKKI